MKPASAAFALFSGLLVVAACTDDGDDTGTPTALDCDCGSITAVSAASMSVNALSRSIELTIDGAAEVDVTCTLTQAPSAWYQLVTAHAEWQYLDDGSLAGDGWTATGFDDGGWSEGRAPLGYGDEANTELDLSASTGGDVLTAWFRVEFHLEDPAAYETLELSWLRDDGIALYLNGTEVARDNLPDGALTPETGAEEKIAGGDEDEWFHTELSSGWVAGTNVLAAEVHQYDKYSEDLSFDARLIGWRAPATVPVEVHQLSSEACGEDQSLSLHGLLPQATYSCQATPTCGGPPELFQFETGPLPDDLPRVAIQPLLPGNLSGTYTLFTHTLDCTEDYTNRLVVVDPEGQIRWYWEHPYLDASSSADIEAEVLDDGTIIVAGGEHKDGAPLIIDADGTIVYEADYANLGDHLYHHDIQWQDGQYLGLVEVDGDEDIEYFGFVRVDPTTDTVSWEWDNRAAHAAGTMPTSQNDEKDPYHANSLAGVTDDLGAGVYASLLHANVILRIDEATGEQSWVLGRRGDFELVDTDGLPADSDAWFNGMHGIDVYGDRLWVYDNGWDVKQSRALMYTLDTDTMTAELTFAYSEAGWSEPVWGDADELASGNVLIDMGHAWCKGGNDSHLGALAEIGVPDKEPIWRLDFLDKDDASYRAQRIDGCTMFGSNTRYCP